MIGERRRQQVAFSNTHARLTAQRHRRQAIQSRGEVYRLRAQPETGGPLAREAGTNDRSTGILIGNIAELKCVEDGRMHCILAGIDRSLAHRAAAGETREVRPLSGAGLVPGA